MRIDEFEFRNEKNQEIEPTKAMLVCYIKALHKDIKILTKALEMASEKILEPSKHMEELKELDGILEVDGNPENYIELMTEFFKKKAEEVLNAQDRTENQKSI